MTSNPASARLFVMIDGYYVDWHRGFGRYIRELVDGLGHFSTSLNVHVIVPKGSKFRRHIGRITYHEIKKFPFVVWEQAVIPAMTLRLRPDIVHSPYNTFPLLHFCKRGQVITIHDLLFFDKIPAITLRQQFGRWYRSLIVSLVPYSQIGIATLTKYMSERIALELGKTATIHRTPVDYFMSSLNIPTEGIPEPFLLHVGGAAYHKNTINCINGFQLAAPLRCHLVVLGIDIRDPFAMSCVGRDIIFPGFVSDGQLINLYERALGLIFPSLAEGYGLPVLEAMACGCAVITSNRAPMTEVASDAALLVDPTDPEDIARAITLVVSDKKLRMKLVSLGRVRTKQISAFSLVQSVEAFYWSSHARHSTRHHEGNISQ